MLKDVIKVLEKKILQKKITLKKYVSNRCRPSWVN